MPRRLSLFRRSASLDTDQTHLEHQGRAGWDDSAGALLTVGEIGRNDQSPDAADLHAGNPLIPALDHLTRADHESKGLARIRRAVELLALVVRGRGFVEPAGVLNHRLLPRGNGRSG